MAFISFSSSFLLFAVGATIAGSGFMIMVNSIVMILGTTLPPAGISFATGIMAAANNIGPFVSTYYMSLLINMSGNTSPRFPILIGMLCFVAIAVIFALVNLKPSIAKSKFL